MTILLIVAISYVALCAMFYFGQHFFFFRPERLPSAFEYEYQFPVSERSFEMDDGGIINAIHFEVPNAKGVVYYLKGNSRSIKGWGKFAKDFLGKGYDFFLMDYRGFGKSKGRRNEQIMYSDALYIYDQLAHKYGDEKIVLYGRSFGSGVAAYVSSMRTPRMLILDSPYFSFRYQIARFLGWMPLGWILRYQIPTYKFLKDTKCPAWVIHGDRDFIISYRQGVMLCEASEAELITIKGGRHNNLPEKAEYHEAIYGLLG